MIVTVTPNTTLDQVLFVPSFQLNRTIRATNSVYSMGGKPTDASWILGKLGIPSYALGFAASSTGQRVEAMLKDRNVTTDFIWVDGETRLSTIIVFEDGSGQSTITTSTLEVRSEHIAELHQRYVQMLDEATCIVLGGTLPQDMEPSFYTEFIRMARERDIPVIFDAGEPNLSAGLVSRPSFVKPNEAELAGLTGEPVTSLNVAYRAGREIIARYGTAPIITLGAEGALAVLPNRAYHIPPLDVDVVSASGAGDGVLAGIAASIYRRQSIEEGLRLGFAIATAILLMPGTADCRPTDVERFLPQIELIPYSQGATSAD